MAIAYPDAIFSNCRNHFSAALVPGVSRCGVDHVFLSQTACERDCRSWTETNQRACPAPPPDRPLVRRSLDQTATPIMRVADRFRSPCSWVAKLRARV